MYVVYIALFVTSPSRNEEEDKSSAFYLFTSPIEINIDLFLNLIAISTNPKATEQRRTSTTWSLNFGSVARVKFNKQKYFDFIYQTKDVMDNNAILANKSNQFQARILKANLQI